MNLSKLPVFLVVLALAIVGAVASLRFLNKQIPLETDFSRQKTLETQRLVQEESAVIDVVEKVSPSVVTVSAKTPARRILEFGPFGITPRQQGGEPQDIGTGFIVSSDGLIVTNKHVVSVTNATYKVITKDNKEHDVVEINRDPSNDIAILKINATGLTPIELGDSSNLKVGQFVIAIGTALGEFRNTVTTGVISGLGRGINAGSALESFVERLDNVIQTDAAINPGNSGGPLMNSSGQVIGVNVAVAQGAQNIGFAIPINTVSKSLDAFRSSGKFPARTFLGVQYQMISEETASANDVPQGAYVTEVVSQSPAEKANITADDIITEFDGQKLSDNNDLSKLIQSKKMGDTVKVRVFRGSQTLDLTVVLGEAPNQ